MNLPLFSDLFSSPSVFWILSLTTAVAGALRGFSGFGAGLLLAPVYSLFVPPATVVTVILAMNLITTLQMLPHALKSAQWRLVLFLFIPSLFGIPLGLLVLHSIDALLMRRLIAIIVILISMVLLSGWRYTGRCGVVQDSIAGFTSGCLTSLAGVAGPPVVLYLISRKDLSANILRSVFIIYFGLVQVATLAPLAVAGSVTWIHAAYVGYLLPTYVLATAAGGFVQHRMKGRNEAMIRRASLLFLLAIGFMTLII